MLKITRQPPPQNLPMEERTPVRPWHTWSVKDVIDFSGAHICSGPNEQEVQARLAQCGPNRLGQVKQETFWQVFLEEIREPMILLLLVTGLLYSVWGKLSDALTIFLVILTLVGVEVFNEYRAKAAIAGLGKLAEPTTAVRRNGQEVEVPVENLVPDDIILVQAGRHVPADARLIEGYSLAVDEASLTGESTPVEKDADLTLPNEFLGGWLTWLVP